MYVIIRHESVHCGEVNLLVVHCWVAWIAGACDTAGAALYHNADTHSSRAGQPAQQISQAA